jgi:hypothetical protein
VLCCAVLCCAVLCCAVLCCAVLCCAVLCCAVLCCAVLCCAVPRGGFKSFPPHTCCHLSVGNSAHVLLVCAEAALCFKHKACCAVYLHVCNAGRCLHAPQCIVGGMCMHMWKYHLLSGLAAYYALRSACCKHSKSMRMHKHMPLLKACLLGTHALHAPVFFEGSLAGHMACIYRT